MKYVLQKLTWKARFNTTPPSTSNSARSFPLLSLAISLTFRTQVHVRYRTWKSQGFFFSLMKTRHQLWPADVLPSQDLFPLFCRFCTARECIIVKPNFQQTRLCHTLRRSARATIAASSSMEGGYLHVCGAASRRQQEMSHAEYEYVAQLLVLFSAVCTQLGNQGVPEARRPSSLKGNVHKRILFLLEWKINKTTTRKIYYLYLYQLVRMKWRREKTSVHIFLEAVIFRRQ